MKMSVATRADGSPAVTASPSLTLGDELARLAPGWGLSQLCRWPPDAFALTAAVFADSGAYRLVVNPPGGEVWPPSGEDRERWTSRLRKEADAWAASASAGEQEPDVVGELRAAIDLTSPLTELDQPGRWPTLAGLLHLHARADEACAGLGIRGDSEFARLAARRLTESGSLSRLTPDRARVLPKLRPPRSGITLRSLSHHVALDRSEVEARWLAAPPPSSPRDADRLTMLLLPYPAAIHAGDFVPVRGPLSTMEDSEYGFFEYAPQDRFPLERVVSVAERARRQVGDIDLAVLPEGAVDATELPALQEALVQAGVPYLVTGVRHAPPEAGGFGGNFAHFGAGDWQAPPQHKHHRWCLDANQVHQYNLGGALHPGRRWWEAIGIPRRRVTFVTIPGDITICPLVCEDLARPDPVTDVIRSIAPTLVVALLLDGPQLAARWPARYASVLADDPGCSVLTLTALGMALRSQPPGLAVSRAIALWKDAHRGLQQISLAAGAEAVAVTAHAVEVAVPSADGRAGKRVAELVLSGIEQIG